ncbi:unnamed protein product [Effrenium voratum]|uniref:Uncharacterized protein n=1 Tax=Effrenium voratum TaxID=2562239 RepID=A0AA36ISY9_9DINO|nr:unnamed protein product [Effrenium voratum]CAJ1430057.1 unnamed protein product [Effrenium voratum]
MAQAAQELVNAVLRQAVKNHTAEVVQDLIEKHGCNPNQTTSVGGTLLHEVALHGNQAQALRIAKLLVSHGVQATQEDKSRRTAMFPAAKAGNIQLCEFLLGQGCSVDHKDLGHQSPLFYSSRHGHVDLSQLLLTRGADLNAADSNGYTPVFWAAHDDRVNMMKFLVEKGANPKILAKNGKSLLFSATGGAAAYALELGCDPQQQDQLGQTPIFRAVKEDDPQKVKLLVNNGADVDAQDKIGQTSLFYAANLGLKEMVTLLCSHLKASTLHRDMKGFSAKEYAKQHSKATNLAACTKILQAHETKQRLAAQKELRRIARERARKAAEERGGPSPPPASSSRKRPREEEQDVARTKYYLAFFEEGQEIPWNSHKYTENFRQLSLRCPWVEPGPQR